MRRAAMVAALVVTGGVLAGCTGGTAYVGVYGPPVYGPPPFGPYGGPYRGPYGGGVWIGRPVCCEEEQQDEHPEVPAPVEEATGAAPDGEPADPASRKGVVR